MEHRHRSNRRLIAVFSLASNDEWIKAERIARANSPESILSWDDAQTRLMPATTGSESYVVRFELENYTLAVAKEDGAAFVRESEPAPIDVLVENVVEMALFDEKYVAIHDLPKHIKDKRSIEEKVDALANFHHTQGYEELWESRGCLNRLLTQIEQGETGLETHCEELKTAIIGLSGQTQIKRVSVLKHKIANCFLPVDIDLQGWKDTGFNSEYGREIVAAYKSNSPTPLERAQEHLYKGAYSPKEIIKTTSAEVDSAKRDVESLLPKTKFDPGDESFKHASKLLDQLYAGKLEKVKEMISDSDPFHSWFEKLMSTLDTLRDAMDRANQI